MCPRWPYNEEYIPGQKSRQQRASRRAEPPAGSIANHRPTHAFAAKDAKAHPFQIVWGCPERDELVMLGAVGRKHAVELGFVGEAVRFS